MTIANTDIWSKLERPPEWALKAITGGRLSGKTDINPQWRMFAMTELFGPCGVGWRYSIDKLWCEPGSKEQMCAFAQVSVYIKVDDGWSEAIPGIGGNMLIEQQKSGPYTNDEAYKMAVTDAMSVAFKSLGMAAQIYYGNYDGSKYQRQAPPVSPPAPPPLEFVSKAQLQKISILAGELGCADREAKLARVNKWLASKGATPVSSSKELTKADASALIEAMEQAKAAVAA